MSTSFSRFSLRPSPGWSVPNPAIGVFPALVAGVVAAASLAGCGFIERNSFGLFGEEAPPKVERLASKGGRRTARVGIDRAPSRERRVASDVEMLWEIPGEPVEGFVISYGYDDGSEFGRRMKVRAADLERFEDKQYGFVYRYVLRDIPADRPLRVSISAYNGEEISPPSQVVTVDSVPGGQNL